MGPPGDRPVEERAALGACFLLGMVSFALVPIDTFIGLPGPWLVIGSALGAQSFGTWYLFKTRRIGGDMAAWSIFLLGASSGSWYFANFGGSNGPAPFMLFATTPLAIVTSRHAWPADPCMSIGSCR